MKRVLFLLSFLLVSTLLFAVEYTTETIPNPKTSDVDSYVSNPDGIIDALTVQHINSFLTDLERDTRAEIAVVAVNSIGMEDIKYFAIRLFEKWGIGKAGEDNGLLILFVLDQRAITFEVGYGLEGVITDALSKRIQTQAMLPPFKEGDYSGGILAGVEKVDALIRKEPVPELEEEKSAWNQIIPMVLSAYILWGLIAFLLVFSKVRSVMRNKKLKTNQERYYALKKKSSTVLTLMSFIIPFITVIITFFMGKYMLAGIAVLSPFSIIPAGIYSKNKKKKIRVAPIPCPQCGGTLNLLPEKEDNKYLTAPQDLEERIGSVDYDVFTCDNCKGTTEIYAYDNPYSRYTTCPVCKTKALRLEKSYTLKRATYSSEGIKRNIYYCDYCGHRENRDTTIPKLERTVVVSGGGSGSSSSGGSFGGSFGGGRSGGGGATSRF